MVVKEKFVASSDLDMTDIQALTYLRKIKELTRSGDLKPLLLTDFII